MTEGDFNYSKTNNCKRKRSLVPGDDDDARNKIHKRTVLALTKPSYLLGHGAKYVRPENRNMLCRLLRGLVRRHNWEEASGVLSVFLKATYKDRSPETNRLKYSLSMEILKRIEGDRMNPTRFKNLYDIWMRKIGSMKDFPVQARFEVHVEFILFCLTQGNVDEAYHAALGLMQEHGHENDAMSNMIIGMTFYQLWYSKIPKHLQHIEQDESHSHTESDMSVSRFNSLVGSVEDHDAACSEKADTSMQCDSDTSVRNDRIFSVHADHAKAFVEANDYQKRKDDFPQNFRPQGFYMNSAESTGREAPLFNHGGHRQFGSIFSVYEGLDSWLLPIRFSNPTENLEEFMRLQKEMLNDHYKDAVKHLQAALNSTPPLLAALVPLVQLLLIGDQMNEAMSVLDKFCYNLDMPLPMRLRASLLELHVDHNNHAMLSTSFENILKKDPTCSHSMSKLIIMHKNGYYSLESLSEMIALHLDATYAEPDTWKELALCFQGLHRSEEDRTSVCHNGNEEGQNQYFSIHISKVPRIFTEGKSGKSWRLRCRWWLQRHFSKNRLLSEIAAGDLQLLTYKAACAAQIYSEEFHYVSEVRSCLEKENSSRDLLDFLRPHIQSPINIHSTKKLN